MKHNIQIEVQNEDGGSLVKVGGQFEVGRPPGIPVGSDQRSQLAIDMSLKLETPGVYPIVASVEGREAARTSFRVAGGRPIDLPGISGPKA